MALVNFANERLHQIFVDHVFEQCPPALLPLVKDDASRIDNAGCVRLIATPPNGILNLLDHQCRAPQSSEASFFLAVNLKHKEDTSFLTTPRRTKMCEHDAQSGFIVRHFAGDVLYTKGTWLATNNDSLQNPRWLTRSSNELLALLFSKPSLQPAAQQSRQGASFASVGGRFATDLSALVEELKSCEISFVRCMKPNLQKRAKVFDPHYVRSRVRAAGTLSALKFTKRLQGVVDIKLATLMRLNEQPALPAKLKEVAANGAPAFATELLQALGLQPSSFTMSADAVTVASSMCPYLAAMQSDGRVADKLAAEAVSRQLTKFEKLGVGKPVGTQPLPKPTPAPVANAMPPTKPVASAPPPATKPTTAPAAVAMPAAAAQVASPVTAVVSGADDDSEDEGGATPTASAELRAYSVDRQSVSEQAAQERRSRADPTAAAVRYSSVGRRDRPPTISTVPPPLMEEDEAGGTTPLTPRVRKTVEIVSESSAKSTASSGKRSAKHLVRGASSFASGGLCLIGVSSADADGGVWQPAKLVPPGGKHFNEARAKLMRRRAHRPDVLDNARSRHTAPPPAHYHQFVPPVGAAAHDLTAISMKAMWEAVHHEKKETRLSAVRALGANANGGAGGGSAGGPDDASVASLILCRAITDRDVAVRAAAVESAASLHLGAVLALALEDRCVDVRRLATSKLSATKASATCMQVCAFLRALDEDLNCTSDAIDVSDGGTVPSWSEVLASLGALLKCISAPAYTKAALLAAPMAYGPPKLREACAELAADLGDGVVIADVALLDEALPIRTRAVELLLDLKAADGLTHAALADDDVQLRLAVVGALGKLANVPSLVVALDDTSVEVRKAATEQLGQLQASNALHTHALKDEQIVVRSMAIEWLGRLKLPALLAAALSDPSVELRLRTVALLDALEHAPPIAAAAKNDPEVRVRANALEALGRLRQVDAIANGPLSDEDDSIASKAVDILGSLHAAQPLGEVALADGERPELRLAAAKWLVQLRAPREMLPALSDLSEVVRLVAAEGMQQMVTEINAPAARPDDAMPFDLRHHVVEALMACLSDPKRPVRHAGARSLALLGDAEWEVCFPHANGRIGIEPLLASTRPETEEILVALLTVEQAEDRSDAARLIGRRHDVSSAAALRVAAQDRDGSVRVQAVKALGEVRDAESIHLIIDTLDDRSAQVRHQAVLAACMIADQEAVPALVRKLDDQQVLVASAAAAMLHRIQTDVSRRALLTCLLTGRPQVRHGALCSLARWGDAKAVLDGLLEAHLIGPKANGSKTKPEARAAACEVVGHVYRAAVAAANDELPTAHLPPDRVRSSRRLFAAQPSDERGQLAAHDALVPMVDARDEAVRVQAALALGRLGRPHAIKPLVGLCKDKSVLVVEAALRAIEALDFAPFLRPGGEQIVLAGPVLKKMMGHGKLNVKMLILTTAPRIFYVDADTHKPKDCDLRLESAEKDKDGGAGGDAVTSINIYQKSKASRVQCVTTHLAQWLSAIADPRAPEPPDEPEEPDENDEAEEWEPPPTTLERTNTLMREDL